MSVTFWCPDAPTTRQIPYPEQDPTFEIDVSDLPEINLANTNARAAIEMMGLPENDELLGSIEPAEMDIVIARLRTLLQVPEERAAFLEPTTVNGQVTSLTESPKVKFGESVTLGQLLSQRLAAKVAAGAGPEEEERAAVIDFLVPSNQAAERAFADRPRGPQVISFGRDDAYLREQAERFLDLFTHAKEHNYRVCWG